MRGYFYKNLPYRTSIFKRKYYLNFFEKSKYFKFDKNGIPIVYYNGRDIDFPVTVINYYIGLLDCDKLSLSNLSDLNTYLNKHIGEQNKFLFNHDFDEMNWGNKAIWFSNLPHAMLFSFLCRLNPNELNVFSNNLMFYFDSIFQKEIYEDGIFIEYPCINSQPQNGQLFGLFAMFDAFNVNMLSKEKLDLHINKSLLLAQSQMTFLGWTKYNGNRLASPFYHFLHLNQYRVCENYDSRFRKLYLRALIGIIWYPIVVIFKITKKVINIVSNKSFF